MVFKYRAYDPCVYYCSNESFLYTFFYMFAEDMILTTGQFFVETASRKGNNMVMTIVIRRIYVNSEIECSGNGCSGNVYCEHK